MTPETHKATMSTSDRKEPPWWRKEAPENLSIVALAILALMMVITAMVVVVKLAGNAHFIISPQVNETAAVQVRARYCALRLSRLSSLIDPRHYTEEQAERYYSECLEE